MAQPCPKCGKDNPDNAYFCDHCHAHIRSAFGAQPVQMASSAGTISAPTTVGSIFGNSTATAVAEPPAPAGAQPPEVLEAGDTMEPAAALAAPPLERAAAEEEPLPIPGGQARFMELLEQAVESLDTQPEAPPPVVARTGDVTIPLGADPAEHAELAALLERESRRRLDQRYLAGESVTVLPPDTQPPTNTAASNTSGMKEHAVLPPQARGWSYAGFIPFGAFGFGMGHAVLGIVGFLGTILGWFGLWLWLGYIVACGLRGREFAWRHRKFVSVEQYAKSLELWDSAGKLFLFLDALYLLIAWAVTAALR